MSCDSDKSEAAAAAAVISDDDVNIVISAATMLVGSCWCDAKLRHCVWTDRSTQAASMAASCPACPACIDFSCDAVCQCSLLMVNASATADVNKHMYSCDDTRLNNIVCLFDLFKTEPACTIGNYKENRTARQKECAYCCNHHQSATCTCERFQLQ